MYVFSFDASNTTSRRWVNMADKYKNKMVCSVYGRHDIL